MTLSVTVQNPNDEKAKGAKIELPAEVFDAKIRGKTDRAIFKFKKPH